MSMMARFVQITPDLLNELIEKHGPVADLFMEEKPSSRQMPRLDEKRMEALRRAPEVLAASIAGIPQNIREALEGSLSRLGVEMKDLQAGKGGDRLLEVLSRGRDILNSAQPPAGSTPKGRGADFSLDKAWHGVHYLLSGQTEPGPGALAQAVLGGTEFGEDDFGYGPARFLSVSQVAEIARELNRANLEAEMKTRFDPGQMNGMDIYPGGWDTAGAMDWLIEEFRRLKDFYLGASARQYAVVACLV